MLNVVCRSQECVGCCTYQIGFEFPNEQQHLTAALPVVNITLSNGTGIRRLRMRVCTSADPLFSSSS